MAHCSECDQTEDDFCIDKKCIRITYYYAKCNECSHERAPYIINCPQCQSDDFDLITEFCPGVIVADE